MKNLDSKNPKERILDKSVELFYSQGFENTGINQIIQESNSYKKSFYTYFQNKNSLGLEYLEIQEKQFLTYLEKMIQKYDTYENFVHSWVLFQKKLIRNSDYHGCAFALFSNQSKTESKIFEDKIQTIIENWKSLLVEYLNSLKSKEKFPKQIDSSHAVKKMILYYEGALQSYMMTKDFSYIHLLEEELLNIPKK